MKTLRRTVAVLMIVMLAITSVQITDVSAKKKKSSKTKKTAVTKVINLNVGQTKSVKVSLKAKTKKGKTSNKFTVKVSKKGIVKASAKKGKLVLKGLKAGKVKVTLKSKVNKKKKKVLTVKVAAKKKAAPTPIAQDATVEVEQLSSYRFVLKFSKAVTLDAQNITIMSKSVKSGKYLNTVKVEEVSTTDNKNFMVYTEDSIRSGYMVQFTITGVNKNAIVVEVEANVKGTNTVSEEVIRSTTTRGISTSIWYDEYIDTAYGNVVSVANLPAGITYKKEKDGVKLTGKITTPGVFTSQVVLEDENGVQATVNVVFVIGTATDIIVYVPKHTEYVYSDGTTFYSASGYSHIYAAGGSGNYRYNVVNNAGIFSNEIGGLLVKLKNNLGKSANASYGYLSGSEWYYSTTAEVGTYTGQFTVTDYDNPAISKVAQAVVETRKANLVTGKVLTASQQGVRNADVSVDTKEDYYGRHEFFTSWTSTDETGTYRLYLPSGTFEFCASVTNASVTELNKAIAGNTMLNFVLPVYHVQVVSNNGYFSQMNDETWYSADGKDYGSSNDFYLKKGTYSLTKQKWFEDGLQRAASVNVTVNGDMTVEANIGQMVFKQLHEGEQNLALLDNGEYYSFVPQKSGYYTFESSDCTRDPRIEINTFSTEDGWNEVGYNDDSGNGNNFRITVWLEAGKNVYAWIADSDDGETATVTVTYNGETYPSYIGDSEYYYE